MPKTTFKNSVVEQIVQDGDVFLDNKNLLDSVYKLKNLDLLKGSEIRAKRYPGIVRYEYVYNDYHSMSTNNGYSRNVGGVFFTRWFITFEWSYFLYAKENLSLFIL